MALVYALEKLNPPDDMRTAAVLTCHECHRKEKVPVAGVGNNPEWIEKRFIQIGWDADVHNASRCLCPRCVKVRALRRKEAPTIPVAIPTARVLPNLSPDMLPTLGSGTRKPSTPKGDDAVTDMKKLSSRQKGLLRVALESYFDEDKGQYSESYSDHRISEELQIPRAIVGEFRETFYGPIQEDPEIAAFRSMMDQAWSTSRNFQSTLQKMQDKLDVLLKKHGVQ